MQKKRGLPIWSMFAAIPVAIVAMWYLTDLPVKAFMNSESGSGIVKTLTAPQSRRELPPVGEDGYTVRPTTVSGRAAEEAAAVRRSLPRANVSNRSEEAAPPRMTGFAVMGDRVRVTLSDGRVLSERDGLAYVSSTRAVMTDGSVA